MKYGITTKEIAEHKINVCKKLRRVILPVHRHNRLLGYVSRKIYHSDKYPKYLIHKPKGSKPLFKCCTSSAFVNKFTCVITEDILSAIKCSRFADSYALLGVNIPEEVLTCMRYYDTAFVFLDNDNDTVREKQIEIKQKLMMVVDEVIVIEADKDPKEHTPHELEQLILNNPNKSKWH